MGSPHGVRSPAFRPPALGTRGVVCSSHYLASQAGMRLFHAGGNAIDALLATAAALGLVEPHMSGPGGDGFLMLHVGGNIRCLNGAGAAPLAVSRELYADGIPYKGLRSVSVPGLVSLWLEAHASAGRRPLAEVFAPACEIAEAGFPVSAKLAAVLSLEAAAGSPLFTHFASAAVFAPDGRPLREGEVCRNPDYAQTLRTLAQEGPDAFYRGPIGDRIVAFSREHDGLFAREDLDRQRAFWQAPISTTYRGREVFEYPPPSSGHVLLQELSLIEGFDLRQTGYLTPDSIHVMVEAKRLAFADRERYLGDPDHLRIPLDEMLSKDYAALRARLIDPARAAASVEAGRFSGWEDTTCLCAADGEGNAACLLQSIQSAFGSGMIVDGTGVLLNNRMTYWHLEAGHPDELKSGKTVRHTMNPYMVMQDGHLVLLGGTPGADTQVQTNMQVLSHVLDFGLNVQEAVEAPRWRHTGNGTESEWPHTCADELILEGRFPEETREALRRKGHSVRVIGDWEASGSQQMISFDTRNGVISGGSDPRRDSAALAW